MSLEMVPVVLGVLVVLAGLAICADAWGHPDYGPMKERRRRIRAAIDHRGEQMVGIGTVLLGAALIGRDAWRFGTLVVLIGTVLVVWGGIRNRHYIKEIILFRGAARRGMGDENKPRMRIR